MKKIGLVVLLISILLSGCSQKEGNTGNEVNEEVNSFDVASIESKTDVDAFQQNHEGYYLEFVHEEWMKGCSVTNYDPSKLDDFPAYQELIEYGNVGLDNPGIVYRISIGEEADYFSAEFDSVTKEKLSEEGTWFLDVEKEEKIAELLSIIDEIVK